MFNNNYIIIIIKHIRLLFPIDILYRSTKSVHESLVKACPHN